VAIKPRDIKTYVLTTPPFVSILLLGPPGVGKSVQVAEAAAEEAERLGRRFVDFHEGLPGDYFSNPHNYYVFFDFRLSEAVPEDLLGYPRSVDTDHYVYAPPLWAKALSMRGAAGLLFLDELTNVQRDDVIAAAYKVILDRKVGFTRLAPQVRIVAAGNSPEHSEIAREIPAPLVSRMEVVEVSSPTVNEWGEWMDRTYGDAWDRRVLAFLSRFPERLIPERVPASTLSQYPCPRNWTRLALQLKNVPKELLATKVESNVGPEVAAVFMAFLETEVPTLEQLLERPSLVRDLSLDAKFLTAVMVGNAFRASEFERFKPLLDAIADYPEVAVLTLLSMPRPERGKAAVKLYKDSGRFAKVIAEAGYLVIST